MQTIEIPISAEAKKSGNAPQSITVVNTGAKNDGSADPNGEELKKGVSQGKAPVTKSNFAFFREHTLEQLQKEEDRKEMKKALSSVTGDGELSDHAEKSASGSGARSSESNGSVSKPTVSELDAVDTHSEMSGGNGKHLSDKQLKKQEQVDRRKRMEALKESTAQLEALGVSR